MIARRLSEIARRLSEIARRLSEVAISLSEVAISLSEVAINISADNNLLSFIAGAYSKAEILVLVEWHPFSPHFL